MKTNIKILLSENNVIDINLCQEVIDWELEVIDEREMGVERLYEANFVRNIAGVDEPLEITLRVWEYPEGVEIEL